MKKICVVIPTYNEEDNVIPIYDRLTVLFSKKLFEYNYELLFIDNKSTDDTREILLGLCSNDARVKCIFNVHNFNFLRSAFYGLTQSDGDATFFICADMQDPPELLVDFVKEWEQGTAVVIGVKKGSKESFWLKCFRRVYYWVMSLLSESKQISNFNGFGLYDRSFIEIIKKLDETNPYLKDIVATYASSIKKIPYQQDRRCAGKGTTNFFRMYDYAMTGVTSTSKIILRVCTLTGFFLSIISFAVAVITIITKLLYWDSFQFGVAAMSTGVFILGGVQLFFIGILGEYVMEINIRTAHRPLIVEEKRINFEERNQKLI